MSFAFMAIYTGDYLRDTRHLTPQKHGIYFLLLMHCWDSRGPVPLDEQEAAGIANCRSADEIDSLRYVLGKYFVLMDDGYYNARMQKEVERAAAISHARSEAGFKGYQAKAKQLPSKSQARASTPTTTITTTTTPNPPKDAKPAADTSAVVVRPESVSVEVWADFLKVRKAKKAPITETALNGIVREAKKAGISLQDALQTCCMRGWIGFNASWITGVEEPQARRPSTKVAH